MDKLIAFYIAALVALIIIGILSFPAKIKADESTQTYKGETWSFLAADYNGDNVPDLWVVKRTNTGSGKLEVHILNGKDFKTWLAHSPTSMHECPDLPVTVNLEP